MHVPNPGRRAGGQIDTRVLVGLAVVVAIAIAAFFLLRTERPTEPVPAPAPAPDTAQQIPLETVAPAETKEERGDSGREVIASLRAEPGGVDFSQALSEARAFLSDGRKADAQLLYFFAARGGHAPAAYELAEMYDPVHFDASVGLMDQADPFQAFRWYSAARDAGHADAEARLRALRAWAAAAADEGDAVAERLLLQWGAEE